MGSPGASMANVEVYEQRYPLLYLTRREEIDTAGPGTLRRRQRALPDAHPARHRAHPRRHLPRSRRARAQHARPARGLPGSTNHVRRQAADRRLGAVGARRAPTRIEDIQGPLEVFPGIAARTWREVTWASGSTTAAGGTATHWTEGWTSSSAISGSAISAPRRPPCTGPSCGMAARWIARRRAPTGGHPPKRSGAGNPAAIGAGPTRSRLAHHGGHGCPVTDRLALAEAPGGLVYACRCGAVLGGPTAIIATTYRGSTRRVAGRAALAQPDPSAARGAAPLCVSRLRRASRSRSGRAGHLTRGRMGEGSAGSFVPASLYWARYLGSQ